METSPIWLAVPGWEFENDTNGEAHATDDIEFDTMLGVNGAGQAARKQRFRPPLRRAAADALTRLGRYRRYRI